MLYHQHVVWLGVTTLLFFQWRRNFLARWAAGERPRLRWVRHLLSGPFSVKKWADHHQPPSLCSSGYHIQERVAAPRPQTCGNVSLQLVAPLQIGEAFGEVCSQRLEKENFSSSCESHGVDHDFLLYLSSKTAKPQSLQNEFHQVLKKEMEFSKLKSNAEATKLLHRVAQHYFYFERFKGLWTKEAITFSSPWWLQLWSNYFSDWEET